MYGANSTTGDVDEFVLSQRGAFGTYDGRVLCLGLSRVQHSVLDIFFPLFRQEKNEP
jgi:hypothetical protein